MENKSAKEQGTRDNVQRKLDIDVQESVSSGVTQDMLPSSSNELCQCL